MCHLQRRVRFEEGLSYALREKEEVPLRSKLLEKWSV
jgi:hypothetical protein